MPFVALTSACSTDCSPAITAEPGTARRVGTDALGRPLARLDISARVTAGGKPVGGVIVDFAAGRDSATMYDLGGTTTGPDGVAHYTTTRDLIHFDYLQGVRVPLQLSYVAAAKWVGSHPSRKVCNNFGDTGSKPAVLTYQP